MALQMAPCCMCTGSRPLLLGLSVARTARCTLWAGAEPEPHIPRAQVGKATGRTVRVRSQWAGRTLPDPGRAVEVGWCMPMAQWHILGAPGVGVQYCLGGASSRLSVLRAVVVVDTRRDSWAGR